MKKAPPPQNLSVKAPHPKKASGKAPPIQKASGTTKQKASGKVKQKASGKYQEEDQYSLKETGSKCIVPGNDIGKLMYYLESVSSELPECDKLPSWMIDFQNFNLSNENFELMMKAAGKYTPSYMIQNSYFIEAENTPSGYSNEFWKISENGVSENGDSEKEDSGISSSVSANSLLGDAIRNSTTGHVMFFKSNWSKYYYFDPYNNLIKK